MRRKKASLWKIGLLGICLAVQTSVGFAAARVLTLQDCIGQALNENLAIQMTQSDVEKTHQAVKAAKSGEGVSVQAVNTDYWKRAASSHNPNTASDSPTTVVSDQLVFSLPIYTGGKAQQTVNAAILSYETAQNNWQLSRQQTKYQTTVAYYHVLQYKNLLKADGDTINDYTLHLQNLEISYAAGLASRLQLLQTKVNLANAEDAQMRDQAAYRQAVVVLKNLIEVPQEEDIELTEDFPYERAPSLMLTDCVATAQKNRLEISVAQDAVKIAQAQVQIAASAKKPTVALNGYTGLQGSSFNNTNENYYSLYMTVSYNLFDSGLANAQIKEADAAVTKAQKALRQQQETIYADVTQYYWSMQEADKRIQTSKTALEQAEEVCKIAQVSFSAGLETNQDILDAEVALTTARNNYIQALYDYNVNRAGLDLAVGTIV